MAVDLLMLDHRETASVFSTDFEEICRLPLEAGGSYLVLAKGDVSVQAGEIELRLETFNAADDTTFTHTSGDHPFETGHATFSLMFATRLPPEPDPDRGPFAAVLFARRSTHGGGGQIANIQLVALTVEHLHTVTG